MTPHKQLIAHDPTQGQFGDCHRTCIAMILDLHPSDVPHFMEGVYPDTPTDAPECTNAVKMEREFLASHRLTTLTVPFPSELTLDSIFTHLAAWGPDAPVILSGTSGLGSGHSCVAFRGELHDPSGNGLVGPMSDGFWWVTSICVGPTWGDRPLYPKWQTAMDARARHR